MDAMNSLHKPGLPLNPMEPEDAFLWAILIVTGYLVWINRAMIRT